jgi:hypothetical protein
MIGITGVMPPRQHIAYVVGLFSRTSGKMLDVGVFSESSPTIMGPPLMRVTTRVLRQCSSRFSLDRSLRALREKDGLDYRWGWRAGYCAKMRAARHRHAARATGPEKHA